MYLVATPNTLGLRMLTEEKVEMCHGRGNFGTGIDKAGLREYLVSEDNIRKRKGT